MKRLTVFEEIKHKLIVSCQALEDEPLYGSEIMAKMARAAEMGGASAIRANTIADIIAIKAQVNLPIIGIIKSDYPDSKVVITPTIKEIEALIDVGVDIIALDATDRVRPNGVSLRQLFVEVKKRYPDQLFMADISTIDEAKLAEELGFDLIATTLVGYTASSLGAHPFDTLKSLTKVITTKIIAEGNFDTPEKAKHALELGAYAVVVGSAITRPQLITKKFVDAIEVPIGAKEGPIK